MKKDVYAIVYTKEKSKLEFTREELKEFDYFSVTYHRDDGPAREWIDGYEEWWVDGIHYTKKEFDKIIEEAKLLPLELRLTDPRWWVRKMK